MNILDCLKRYVDFTQIRQKALTQNVSNLNTPSYKAIDVSFRDMLKPKIFQMESNTLKPNGNNVSIDQQMSEISKNKALHDLSSSVYKVTNNLLIESIGGQK